MKLGANSRIGAFVEIQKGARIGKNCKISSHSFICEGVTVADDVFIGHHVVFINDRYPRAANAQGQPQTSDDWTVRPTVVERGASIGSGAVILCDVVHDKALRRADAVTPSGTRSSADSAS